MAIDRIGISSRMKNQTIGVEIEMYNITRENAAKITAEFFGTGRYSDTSRIDGYHAWSAFDADGRRWKFVKDSSICENIPHYPDDMQCELVTPILHYDDIPVLQELIRRLRKAGAKSDPKNSCGVHIHIGVSGHTAQSLMNITNIMASHENLLIDAVGIDSSRISDYCKPVDSYFLKAIRDEKPKTLDELALVWYRTQPSWRYAPTDHYHSSRYHMLNLHSVFTKGTIEFRCFNFRNPDEGRHNGLHAGMVKSWIQLCLAISQFAKDSKFCKSTKCATVNNLRTMRNFINNLGLGGEEFVTLRHILTENFKDKTKTRNARANRQARRCDNDVALMAV